MAEDQTDIPPYDAAPKKDEPSAAALLVRNIFFGPRELRAGWRLLIFLVLAFAIVFVAAIIQRALISPSLPQNEIPITPAVVIGELTPFLALLISAFTMAKLEGRKMLAYGLSTKGAFGGQFWIGAVWGFVALTVLLLTISAFGDFTFGGPLLHWPGVVIYGASWFVMFTVVGLFEEYLFRGYPLFTLTTGMGFWPSAIILSLLFALPHMTNPGESWLGVLQVAPFGLFFCLTVRRTGSLWFPIGFHAAWDWGQSYFYGTPDSGLMAQGHLLDSSFHGPKLITGGTVGAEGSIFIIPLFVIALILFHLVYRQSKYPDRESLAPVGGRLSPPRP